MKTLKLLAIFITVIALAWMAFCQSQGDKQMPKSILGLNLVAKYEPLHLYIYADTKSTNANPDYLICEGNTDLISRENMESNMIDTTYYENGIEALVIERNGNNKVLRRMVSYSDAVGNQIYTYVDNHDDGLWDVFLDHNNEKYYVRSNLCWILRFQGK